MEINFFHEYRDCTFYNVQPGRYMVSEYGQVIDKWTGRTMIPYQTRNGYWYVRLDDIFFHRVCHCAVHRLVAWEFCPGRNVDLDINHIDGNKSNNHYSNLEWVTRQENIIHSVENGLAGKGDHRGILNGQAKLNEQDVRNICELLQNTDLSYRSIIEKLDLPVTQNAIKRIKQKTHWTEIVKDYDFSHRG